MSTEAVAEHIEELSYDLKYIESKLNGLYMLRRHFKKDQELREEIKKYQGRKKLLKTRLKKLQPFKEGVLVK